MVRIIVLQDRSLYHIYLPPLRKGETAMGVPTNVTSIVAYQNIKMLVNV